MYMPCCIWLILCAPLHIALCPLPPCLQQNWLTWHCFVCLVAFSPNHLVHTPTPALPLAGRTWLSWPYLVLCCIQLTLAHLPYLQDVAELARLKILGSKLHMLHPHTVPCQHAYVSAGCC